MEYQDAGEELGVGEAIAQASIALDSAGTMAQRRDAPDIMLQVAENWLKLADFMAALEQHERAEAKEKDDKEDVPFGFKPTVVNNTDGEFELSATRIEEGDELDDDED
jgi:hypothetical protein